MGCMDKKIQQVYYQLDTLIYLKIQMRMKRTFWIKIGMTIKTFISGIYILPNGQFLFTMATENSFGIKFRF